MAPPDLVELGPSAWAIPVRFTSWIYFILLSLELSLLWFDLWKRSRLLLSLDDVIPCDEGCWDHSLLEPPSCKLCCGRMILLCPLVCTSRHTLYGVLLPWILGGVSRLMSRVISILLRTFCWTFLRLFYSPFSSCVSVCHLLLLVLGLAADGLVLLSFWCFSGHRSQPDCTGATTGRISNWTAPAQQFGKPFLCPLFRFLALADPSLDPF